MKKVLSVMIAVVVCVALCATAASAATYGNLSSDEIASILGVDEKDLGNLDNLVKNLEASNDTASSSGGLGDILGGFDISSIAGSLTGGDDALSSITSMFEGIDLGNFDISSLTDMISGVFGDSGISLDSITGSLGSFDIGSILGGISGGSSDSSSGGSSGGSSSGGVMDTMSSLMDGLMSGLGGLGLDTSMLDGLLDSDIVNFFANLYMGIGDKGGSATEATTATTTAPAVVTTSTPKTGDTSAVLAAVATITVAAGAAFVCLKKKND